MSLTREGLREFEEVSKEFETVGAGDDKEKMPETAHQLVARCVERDILGKSKKSDGRLTEHRLVQGTGHFLGDPERTAKALAAGAYAGGHGREGRSAEAPAPEPQLRSGPAEAEAPSIDELAKPVLNILEAMLAARDVQRRARR